MDTTALRAWFDALPQDEFEEFKSVDSYEFDEQVKTVLALMAGYSGAGEEAPGCERISWVAERDGDGSIAGWNIGVTTTDHAWYLYQYVDWAEVTDDGSATGVEQAWNIVTAIAGFVDAAMALAEAKQL